jgi:hypothetical protein
MILPSLSLRVQGSGRRWCCMAPLFFSVADAIVPTPRRFPSASASWGHGLT